MQNNGHYAVQGHSRSPILVPIGKLIYDFLLVINTNSLPITLFTFKNRLKTHLFLQSYFVLWFSST